MKGKPSTEQLKTQKIINATDYAWYMVIYGYEACIEVIEGYL
jgi:hypothetical protein